MHEIVVFSLVIVSIFRIFGVLVALDFYIESKASRYKAVIVGWAFWLMGGVLALISLIITNQEIYELLHLYNTLISTIGIVILSYTLVSNFLSINKGYVIIYFAILFVISHLLFFIVGYELSISFSSLYQQTMWIFLMLLPIIKWKKFKARVDRGIWYSFFILLVAGLVFIPIGIIISLQGYSYGLYNSDDVLLITFNYGFLLTITLVIHILIIHMKFRETLSEKSELKDKYSHNLGNAIQAIYTALELTENYNLNEQDEKMVRQTSDDKIKEAAELLKEIRDI
jgi:hypothetical protein